MRLRSSEITADLAVFLEADAPLLEQNGCAGRDMVTVYLCEGYFQLFSFCILLYSIRVLCEKRSPPPPPPFSRKGRAFDKQATAEAPTRLRTAEPCNHPLTAHASVGLQLSEWLHHRLSRALCRFLGCQKPTLFLFVQVPFSFFPQGCNPSRLPSGVARPFSNLHMLIVSLVKWKR